MALKYPDRIESNNPLAYGIAKATEISGARNAAEYGGILDIPDNILSTDGTGNDASLLLWIEDNYVYRLVDWKNRRNNKGWQVEYAYIPWDSTSHLNSFTQSGNYYIAGDSNGLAGGLPIINGDPGHTIEATLRVLDSSLTKDEDLKQLCITLILSLSNRMGGDGHIYVRTIQTLEKDNLTRNDIESPSCTKWSTWEKLQGIFEKNVAANIQDIDTYTTNGMYSVVSGSTSLVSGFLFKTGDTLLIITVNGYHVFKSGFNPQLTQLVYVLPAGHNPSSGAIEYQLSKLITRTALWNKTTKLWDYHDFQDLTDLGRIKEIKVNDTPLTIDSDKAINLDLEASYLEAGLDSHIVIALKDKNNSSVLKDIKVLMPFVDSSKDGLMIHSDKEYLDLLQNKDHFRAITWSTSFNANNYHNGNYRITGIRTSLSDNLPMQNAADGHSIDCYLKVLDSSLKPTADSSVSEACVTQILTTSNRVGGDGHIYVRTGEALSGGYNNLSWSTWECLQGVFEKNLTYTTALNTYTTNGMYSGVFIDSNTVSDLLIKKFSTFLLIAVNGTTASSVALLSGETNSKAQLALLLYLTPIHQGTANIYLRTATWNGSSWQFGNFLRLITFAEYLDILNNGLFQLRVSATEDNNRLIFINLNNGETGGVDLPKASNTTAGIMTATDKVKLDALSSEEINAKFEALKVEFERLKETIGVNTHIYGHIRVSGVSDPQLSFKTFAGEGANDDPLDVIHPCLVEKGTGKLLHILQNLNFEKDVEGNPRKIDGSEGEVYITNTEPIYHITGHVYVNGVSYDVFLRSLFPFAWQGKEAERIEPFGLSPDNCVAHKDDSVTRMHSVYNPEWAGSYCPMNGFVGKFVYEGIGSAMTETYDENGALFDGAGGLASVYISLTNGEQYAMNMNEDTTKTVPFFNEHAYALELFIGHMLAEGGTYDAHNAALMGSGFTANDNVTNAAHFNVDNELAVNGARYLGGDDNTTRYVGNGYYGIWFADGTRNCIPDMLTHWTSPWKIMERLRVMAYAMEHEIPELTWFAFEGNKYKWRSVSGFAGPNDGVMTCVVFKIFSTKFAANMVDPTGGASLEGHRIDFMVTGAMYRGWSTDVSPSRLDSGLIFTIDNTGLYKAYIQRDQSNMVLSANANANEDTVLKFEESYDYIGSVQGVVQDYRRDFSDGSLFFPKSTEQAKGGGLHTYTGSYGYYTLKNSGGGLRSVYSFMRGYSAGINCLSPYMTGPGSIPSYANSHLGFGTCVQIASEPQTQE